MYDKAFKDMEEPLLPFVLPLNDLIHGFKRMSMTLLTISGIPVS